MTLPLARRFRSGQAIIAAVLLIVIALLLVIGLTYKLRCWRLAPAATPQIPKIEDFLKTAADAQTLLKDTRDVTLTAAEGALKSLEDSDLAASGAPRDVAQKVFDSASALDALDNGLEKTRSGLESDLKVFETVRAKGFKEAPPADKVEDARRAYQELTQAYGEIGPRMTAVMGASLKVVNRALRTIERTPGRGLSTVAGRADFKAVRTDLADELEKALYAAMDRHPGWFKVQTWNILIALVFVSGAVLYFIRKGARGEKLAIRRIAGLDAIDEAVGRATEMGKSVLYVTGIMDIDDIGTLAGLNILGHVARRTAEYEAELKVPCLWPMALSSAQEVVREAYIKARKPDSHRPENVYYLTSDQFAFAAGTSGIMVRERPATIFYMGTFYAESLLMAEVGNVVGAIQVAGTAQVTQLPFFVAACDYTLIGEELFAASAYLSHDPTLLGSLKGQDLGKLVVMIALVAGCLLEVLIGYGWVGSGMSILKLFSTPAAG